ncbi:hypothetical protein Chor_000969 [Crotalus horridus]
MKPTSEPLPREHSTETVLQCILKESSSELDSLQWLSRQGASDHSFLLAKAEELLENRIKDGEPLAYFLKGQLYFEEKRYEDALLQFEQNKDFQSMYQLGVMYYDGLGTPPNSKLLLESYLHQLNVVTFHLKYETFMTWSGMQVDCLFTSELWLFAADHGNPKASVKAQSTLGMLYSAHAKDLKKAFFWHSEACGNGSLESQGILGIMYLHGHGIRQNLKAALECLNQASHRGNVYAKGHLVEYYYKRNFFIKAAEFAKRVTENDNVEKIAEETDCLPFYISRGLAMASFYLARCLHLGRGTQQDIAAAKNYYSKVRKG